MSGGKEVAMAITIPVEFSQTVVDEWGIEASTPAYAMIDGAMTVTQLVAQANTLVADLDAATGGQITKQRVTILPVLPGGIKTGPVAGSRVEQTGLVGFGSVGATVTSATDKRWSYAIPAIANTPTVLSGDRIVLTGADPVGVLITLLTTVGTLIIWCNNHQQQITAFKDALIAFRKRRKQLQRSSFEV
jgi:hypothetical protein